MTSRQRLAGVLLLIGITIAVAWRTAVAPAVLGDFDPASMPHRDRAFLSIGNVGVAVLFAVALSVLAGIYVSARNRRVARAAATFASVGAVSVTVGTIGLVWWHAGIIGLWAYIVCAALAWALSGYAAFREYRGVLGWTALLTGAIYGLAMVVIFTGGFAIFIMTVGAMPFAIALIATAPASPSVSRGAPVPAGSPSDL